MPTPSFEPPPSPWDLLASLLPVDLKPELQRARELSEQADAAFTALSDKLADRALTPRCLSQTKGGTA
jgi:hypothetical protein